MGRVLRKGVQDVGEHQLLMLLLVMQPDLDNRNDFFQRRLVCAVQKLADRGIDMSAIGGHLLDTRTGNQSALRPRMPGACRNIIGVEQEAEALVEFAVVRGVRLQQEGLEEPGGVGAMPFRGARVRHRLHDLVFRRQMRGAALGLRAHRSEIFRPDAPNIGSRRR